MPLFLSGLGYAFAMAGFDGREYIKYMDGYGCTPLHAAAAFSKTLAVVQALLDASADPKARDEDGKTVFDLIPDDSPLKGTDIYWRLNEARF